MQNRIKDFVSVDLAENVGTIVNALGTKQPLKNLVSMLIKDKDITSYQLLLYKTRLCACKLKYLPL